MSLSKWKVAKSVTIKRLRKSEIWNFVEVSNFFACGFSPQMKEIFWSACFRCVYKSGQSPQMSMHGKVFGCKYSSKDLAKMNFKCNSKVADFQMWDKVLPDEQLEKVKFHSVSMAIRAQWESRCPHILNNIIYGQMYSYVKLNFKAGLFSSTFLFGRI